MHEPTALPSNIRVGMINRWMDFSWTAHYLNCVVVASAVTYSRLLCSAVFILDCKKDPQKINK